MMPILVLMIFRVNERWKSRLITASREIKVILNLCLIEDMVDYIMHLSAPPMMIETMLILLRILRGR